MTAASDSYYASENGCLHSESQLLNNVASPVPPALTLSPATASRSSSFDNSSFMVSSEPRFSTYDKTSSSTFTSPSFFQSCEAEDEYCEDNEIPKKKNNAPICSETCSSITILPSNDNSATDTDEHEGKQRNSAPSADTLDEYILMSEEEPAAEAQLFTPQIPSSSPLLFNSPIHSFTGHKSKSSLRSAPLTHYFQTPDNEERKYPPLTDNLDNNLSIFSRQSEEEFSAECPLFTPQTHNYSSPTLFISSMPILSIYTCRSKSSPRPPPLTLSLDTPENNSLTGVDTEAEFAPSCSSTKLKEELENMCEANCLSSPQYVLSPPLDTKKSGLLRSNISYIFYCLFSLLLFLFTFIYIFHLFCL